VGGGVIIADHCLTGKTENSELAQKRSGKRQLIRERGSQKGRLFHWCYTLDVPERWETGGAAGHATTDYAQCTRRTVSGGNRTSRGGRRKKHRPCYRKSKSQKRDAPGVAGKPRSIRKVGDVNPFVHQGEGRTASERCAGTIRSLGGTEALKIRRAGGTGRQRRAQKGEGGGQLGTQDTKTLAETNRENGPRC